MVEENVDKDFCEFENIKKKLLKIDKFDNKETKTQKLNQENLYNELFNDFLYNGQIFKNRFCFNNLTDNFLYKNGMPTNEYVSFYQNVAKSDVGIIFTGGVYVGIENFKKLSDHAVIVEDLGQEGFYKNFTNEIHTTGAKIFLKIKSIYGRADYHNKFLNIFNYSASMNKNLNDSKMPCARLGDNKCDSIVKEFGDIANFAQKVNFDGILIDGTLFSIVGELSSKEFNRRKFGYYNDIKDISKKILKNIKQKTKNCIIFYEFSFSSFLKEIYGKNAKFIKTLKNLDLKVNKYEICEYMKFLVENGVDGFVFKLGTYESEFLSQFNQFECENLFFEFYRDIREYFTNSEILNKFGEKVLLIYNDNILKLEKPSQIIQNETCEFIDVTKFIYSDFDYIKNLKMQNNSNLCLKCSICNDVASKFGKVSCTINPNLLSEELIQVETRKNKNVAVVGAGVSGINATIYLATRGFNVDLYDSNSILNKTGRCGEIFGFDERLNYYNNFIENKLGELIKKGQVKLKLGTKFTADSDNLNNYFSIIVATGFHERFLEVTGAVLRNVKSIYDVLESENTIESKKNIVIYAKSEISFKLALYLLSKKKHVTIVIQNLERILKMPNDRLTYYLFMLNELRAKVYLFSRIKRIENDFVELIINNKLKNENFSSIILNSKSNNSYPFEAKAKTVDCDLLVYEPELYSNNKLYYDLVKKKYKGELYLIGNALQISGMEDDIKTAYYVAKNL